ncbi:hypothetical protein Dimus_022637, partial [Dionaea muscipula]
WVMAPPSPLVILDGWRVLLFFCVVASVLLAVVGSSCRSVAARARLVVDDEMGRGQLRVTVVLDGDEASKHGEDE